MESFNLDFLNEIISVFVFAVSGGFALATVLIIAMFGVYKVFNTFCSLTR